MVLEVHQGKCGYKEPDWLTAARFNPEATAVMRAHARSLESYVDPEKVKYVKLLDGGVTDNFGTTGLAVERARAQAAYAPMTPEEAVRLKRLLFLVADAGVQAHRTFSAKPDAIVALVVAALVAWAVGSVLRGTGRAAIAAPAED